MCAALDLLRAVCVCVKSRGGKSGLIFPCEEGPCATQPGNCIILGTNADEDSLGRSAACPICANLLIFKSQPETKSVLHLIQNHGRFGAQTASTAEPDATDESHGRRLCFSVGGSSSSELIFPQY